MGEISRDARAAGPAGSWRARRRLRFLAAEAGYTATWPQRRSGFHLEGPQAPRPEERHRRQAPHVEPRVPGPGRVLGDASAAARWPR